MKLSQSDKSLLFSSTEIPDVFFTEYLPESSGDFIKVYLHMIFLSKYNNEFKINDLSKTLALDFPVIQDAITFWENKGLLIKNPNGYSLANIQEIELSKIYSPKVSIAPEDAIKNSENQYRAKAIENINKQFFQGVMSPSWYNDISLWFSKYGFDEQVMLALFNYCYENRALHRNYIQTVAEGWASNNIKTFNDLDLYFEKQEKRSIMKKQIAKKLNLFRNLTSYDEEYIVKWTENYNFPMEIIDIALKRASAQNNIRFEYIDKILTDWHEKDLRSPDEVQTYLDASKTKEKKEKDLKKAITYEYTQSTFDNLDSLYDN